MIRILVALVAAFAVGTALATVPFGEDDPCLNGPATAGEASSAISLGWPLRTRCTYRQPHARVVVHEIGPSTREALLVVALTGLLFAAAAALRHAALRGATIAAGAVAVVAILYAFMADPIMAVMAGIPASALAAVFIERALRAPWDRSLRAATASALMVVFGATQLFCVLWIFLSYEAVAAAAAAGAALALLATRIHRAGLLSPSFR